MTKRTQKAATNKEKPKNSSRTSSSKATLRKTKSSAVKSVSYQDYLINSLKEPEEAAGYLNAALESGDINVFLLALQNVIQAQGGIAALAAKTKKSRTSLYKSLSENGNPYLKNANELLLAMGMHLSVVPNEQRASH
ncbi:MAG: transcriptional regulator [Gammaproteobacteria bacterium]